MGKGRLEAFSDGVLAIVITIMVLELKVPHGADLASLRPLLPVLISYVVSFVYIGIYWNNHHHMLHAAEHVDGGVMWANHHLLFWLSLVPATTNWVGEHPDSSLPAALYGVNFFMAAIAYTILQTTLIKHHGKDSLLGRAVGSDAKGMFSLAAYATAVGLAFVHPYIAYGIYVLVAIVWVIPDRRITREAAHTTAGHQPRR